AVGCHRAMVNPSVLPTLMSMASPQAVSFELFADTVPKAAENFHALEQLIPGFMFQSGDFTCHNGTGSKPTCREKLDDESFIPKHVVPVSCSLQTLDPTQMVPRTVFICSAKTE
uniref:PPIase cyclophilin-type domain-containing protein n=1 Tax=Equus asinus asinus TaxID=83772 RepID=A0A8C4MEK1_EQUAS